jgi:hypothetical protein
MLKLNQSRLNGASSVGEIKVITINTAATKTENEVRANSFLKNAETPLAAKTNEKKHPNLRLEGIKPLFEFTCILISPHHK